MKTATAEKILRKKGWADIPDADEAGRMLADIRASGDQKLDGYYVTKRERQALRCLTER